MMYKVNYNRKEEEHKCLVELLKVETAAQLRPAARRNRCTFLHEKGESTLYLKKKGLNRQKKG